MAQLPAALRPLSGCPVMFRLRVERPLVSDVTLYTLIPSEAIFSIRDQLFLLLCPAGCRQPMPVVTPSSPTANPSPRPARLTSADFMYLASCWFINPSLLGSRPAPLPD